TVLLITHYMDEAAQCDRVVVVENGKLLMDDTPKRVFSNVGALRRVGLDVPQTAELIYDLKEDGIKIPVEVLSHDECVEALYTLLKNNMVKNPKSPRGERKAKDFSGVTVLEGENLSFKYSSGTPYEKTAVDDVSFTVEKGDFLAVIGHTGSGKSTLIQHLNGLLKPTSGRVLLDGEDIWKNPKEIRNVRFKVGLVFQYPEYQLFEETVFKDIAFGPKNMGLDEAEIKKRVFEAASFFGIPHEMMEKSPFELSGGEKRRV
ncbi:MAG: ATP-binding cassette domain-containing protein, partial [Oscillospiraceae bacterium]